MQRDDDVLLHMGQMAPEEANKRYGKWKLAVERSFGLDALADDFGEDDDDDETATPKN